MSHVLLPTGRVAVSDLGLGRTSRELDRVLPMDLTVCIVGFVVLAFRKLPEFIERKSHDAAQSPVSGWTSLRRVP